METVLTLIYLLCLIALIQPCFMIYEGFSFARSHNIKSGAYYKAFALFPKRINGHTVWLGHYYRVRHAQEEGGYMIERFTCEEMMILRLKDKTITMG
jgi:hypothetical protein